MSQHTRNPEYTREEWEAVHLVDGMAYVLKPEYLTDAWYEAQSNYQRAVDRFGWNSAQVKRTAREFTRVKHETLLAAIAKYRSSSKVGR